MTQLPKHLLLTFKYIYILGCLWASGFDYPNLNSDRVKYSQNMLYKSTMYVYVVMPSEVIESKNRIQGYKDSKDTLSCDTTLSLFIQTPISASKESKSRLYCNCRQEQQTTCVTNTHITCSHPLSLPHCSRLPYPKTVMKVRNSIIYSRRQKLHFYILFSGK